MDNYLTYKGYRGSVSFSGEDKVFYGKVLGIRDSVSFEGTDVKQLEEDFHNVVDDYLDACKAAGRDPDKEFRGVFNVRIKPELHKKAYYYALDHHMTLNELMTTSLDSYLNGKK